MSTSINMFMDSMSSQHNLLLITCSWHRFQHYKNSVLVMHESSLIYQTSYCENSNKNFCWEISWVVAFLCYRNSEQCSICIQCCKRHCLDYLYDLIWHLHVKYVVCKRYSHTITVHTAIRYSCMWIVVEIFESTIWRVTSGGGGDWRWLYDENPASHRYGTFVWLAVALLNAFRLSNAAN